MATTQEHLPIEDIKEGILFLKDRGATVVIKTSAVNFGLLSPDEQMAIIGSFAQMLNSLSFAIQILIYSRRLDITSYLKLLDRALSLQPNQLLAKLMINYRQFVQSLIKDNEVLDKSFYIAISVSHLEMGFGLKTIEDRLKKAKTILEPRRDQVMRQLSRVGLKADQLDDSELLQLFYDIYNTPENQPPTAIEQPKENKQSFSSNKNVILGSEATPESDSGQARMTPIPQTTPPAQPPQIPIVQQPSQTSPIPHTPPGQGNATPLTSTEPQQRPRSHPFVVEELTESP